MTDKFTLITPGYRDSASGVIRIPPDCYRRIVELRNKTGVSLCRIVEQCIDFALEHMEESE